MKKNPNLNCSFDILLLKAGLQGFSTFECLPIKAINSFMYWHYRDMKFYLEEEKRWLENQDNNSDSLLHLER